MNVGYMPTNLEIAIMNFDFMKVHTIMTIMGWCWDGNESSPSIERMKQMVTMLHSDLGGRPGIVSSGGFRVELDTYDTVTIMFVLEESDSTW